MLALSLALAAAAAAASSAPLPGNASAAHDAVVALLETPSRSPDAEAAACAARLAELRRLAAAGSYAHTAALSFALADAAGTHPARSRRLRELPADCRRDAPFVGVGAVTVDRRSVNGGHSAAISHWGACSIYSAVADEPALLAEGSETNVTLRDLSIYGASRDFDYEPPWINEDDDDDDEEFESDMYDTAVEVRSGACVKIDNCSLTNCGHASVFAKGGARVHVSDSFISRGWFGVKADGDRASIILSRCRMSGDNYYACCVMHGANIEVYDTEVGDDYTEFHGSGFIVNGEGSRMVLDEDVFHFPSQIENYDPSRGRSEFFIVIDNGTLIVHCDHFRDPRYGNPLRLLQDEDIDFGLFPGRERSGAGKTEPVPEGYAIIHSSGWQG